MLDDFSSFSNFPFFCFPSSVFPFSSVSFEEEDRKGFIGCHTRDRVQAVYQTASFIILNHYSDRGKTQTKYTTNPYFPAPAPPPPFFFPRSFICEKNRFLFLFHRSFVKKHRFLLFPLFSLLACAVASSCSGFFFFLCVGSAKGYHGAYL
jgi:hypothetical protein